MANEEHVAILRQGVEAWNAWRKANPDIVPDLEGVKLQEAYLQRVNLQWANLSGADLSSANLQEANLTKADLTGAILRFANLNSTHLNDVNLTKAVLTGAYLIWTDLRRANLAKADLTGVYLAHVQLSEANFTQAYLRYTVFADNDLSSVQGLEIIGHLGASTIGIDTLYKSGGNIPESFLRGCGVPDSLIEYLPSLIGAMQPIQFYSCFISYSTKDEAFAKRLHSRMQQEHLRVWFAPEELKGGHKLRDQIDDAIRVYDKLLLILSDASMASDWVAHEIRRASTREHAERKRVLFPIRLTDYESLTNWELPDGTGRDLALEVRHYYIPDFSTWKDHDAFEAAFAQLLKALRADEKGTVKQ